MRSREFGLAVALSAFASLPAFALPPHPRHATDTRSEPAAAHAAHVRPAGVTVVDNTTFIDINNISMPVTNTGSIAWNKITGSAGLEFPKGSGHTAVFAAGPWLGASVGGQVRVAISEYSDEFGPGQIIGGLPDNPNLPEYHVYKLNRTYALSSDRDAALASYNAGAVPHGAPPVSVLGDGSLSILGDQMLWCVFNDADPAYHTNRAGLTAPLGVEIQLTAFAFTQAGPLDHTIFLRYRILNKGSNLLQNFRLGLWADPDLGFAGDDVTACDPARSMGYCYNATNNDGIYGTTPPAVGFDMLRGPIGTGGLPMPMTAFESYLNGTDPDSYQKTFNALSGLNPSGGQITDPTTGLPTTFMFSGDPTTGTGWIDPYPADKRLLVASNAADFAPGQVQELTFAIIAGQGPNRIASIQALRCDDDQIQMFFDHGYAPPPSPTPCALLTLVNCPRTAGEWYQDCQPGSTVFTQAQIAELAARVDAGSLTLDWGSDPVGGLLATLAPMAFPTPRQRALREYAAFLCNDLALANPVILPASGQPAYLDPTTSVSCAGLAATTIQELAATAAMGIAAADYVDIGPNPTALAGANYWLRYFGGGAGYAADFYGSSIPSGSPTHSVEVRFTGGATGQYAYRYLRTVNTYGGESFPIQDYVPAPWIVWDLDTNSQLNGAFLENEGPPPSANFDGMWDPDASTDGGREYLWVMNSPYSGDGTPDPAYFTNPLLMNALFGGVDFRYVLAARRVSAGAVIDPGDVFRFTYGIAPDPGADTRLLQLAALAPGDPAAAQGYDDVSTCLMAINSGIGIGTTCNSVTATLASLVSTDATMGRVTVTWYVEGANSIRVERSESGGPWSDQGAVQADGRGFVIFGDTQVIPGRDYSYRLRLSSGGGVQFAGEVTVTVPLHATLALDGFRPNPARGPALQVAFSLANAAPATLSIYDVAGRRCYSSPVGAMGTGAHLMPISSPLPSGLYMLRLEQGGQSLHKKAAVVR